MKDVPNVAADTDTELTGTWIVPVSRGRRWAALGWRMGIASGLTAWLFYMQVQNDAPAPYMLWGFGIFALGTFLGVRAFGVRERRIFDATEVHYTRSQRAKRAVGWFVAGLAMLAFIWGVQAASDQLTTYWWYAWPALFPMLVGVGLYMLRTERVLSEQGQHARAQVDAAKAMAAEKRMAWVEAVAGSGPARYVGAVGCLYAAYWLSTESTGKNAGWTALALAVLAFFLARELALWLLGIGLIGGVAWALFAGISALPVSAAVIVGALIIAAAVARK